MMIRLNSLLSKNPSRLASQAGACLLLLAIWMIASIQPCSAQSTYGSILGSVTDANGAAVPNVSVTVTNVNTNISRQVMTDKDGNYEATHLLPGVYRVRAESAGFKISSRENVIVESRAALRIDVRLEVGDQTSTVQVTAATPVIETESAQIADVRNAKQLNELPSVSNTEMFAYLMTLPGIQSVGTFTYSFNGTRSSQYEFQLDGINSPRGGGSPLGATHNTFEMIEEFKIHAANNSAEFASPGVISVTTKSGTNKLHGSLFYFHNNSALNARGYFQAQKPVTKTHVFGFSLGGPVYAPKLYDGRNRTFFMLSYWGERIPGKGSANATVPTAAMRQGDFSRVVDAQGRPLTIRDPQTGAAFPENRIPASRLDPISLRVMERFYPLPNFGSPDLLSLNHRILFDRKTPSNKWDVRIDQKITERNLLYLRVGYRAFPNQPLSNNLPAIGTQDQYRRTSSFVLSDTHTFTPRLINEFRLGTQRSNNRIWGPLPGLEVLRFTGIRGINPAEDRRGMPQFSITGFNTIGSANATLLVDQVVEGTDTLTWIHAGHSIKAGIDLQRNINNGYALPASYFGSFSFNGFFTGQAFADYLLGLPRTATRATFRGPEYQRGTDLFLFAQDDWKISPKATLSLGVRYEYQFPSVDKNGLMYNLDPRNATLVVPDRIFNSDAINPLLPAAIKVVKASEAGFPQTLRRSDRNNIVPRLGIAVRPWRQTVIRAGYGVFVDNFGTSVAGPTGSPLFGFTETFENLNARQPTYTFPNPFGATGSIGTISGSGFNVNIRNPYVQQWNLTAEREIVEIGFRVSYIGTKATQLLYRRDLNVPPPSATPFSNTRRPFPQYRGLTLADNGGTSIYHGLQMEAERRFSRGLFFQAAWTYSNLLSDVDDAGDDSGPTIENPFDRRRERARQPYSVRHRVNGGLIYDLPVGQGRRFLNKLPGVLDHILGGWTISSLLYFETGRFFTPTFTGVDISGTGITGGRPDRLRDGNLPSGERRVTRWFDAGAFAVPAANIGRFGASARNILEGPGLNLQHFSLLKRFRLSETAHVQFQLNVLNLFNHPNFDLPNANISAPNMVGQITATRGLLERAGARSINAELRINF